MPRRPIRNIAASPRSWLTRKPGECAFPVDGEGWRVRSCCNPCAGDVYCKAHRRLARSARAAPIEAMVDELRLLGLCD